MIPGSASAQFFGAAGSAGAGGYEIERSLRFNSSDSAYLSRTPSVAGNRKTFTLSCWVKKATLGTDQGIFNAGTSSASSGVVQLYFMSSNQIAIFTRNSSGVAAYSYTTSVYRDASAWYHIVLSIDTTQASFADQQKLWVNGVQVTTWDQSQALTQNTDLLVNSTVAHYIGGLTSSGGSLSNYLSSYLADYFLIDGQALDPSSFGEFDTNGVWQPKAYAGSYGTNGFHLPFSDNSTAAALGTDTSGNGNDWTVNNITAISPSLSSPSNGNTPVYQVTIGPTNPTSGLDVWSNAFDANSATYGIIGPITFTGTKPTWSTTQGVELMASGNGITASVNGGTQIALTNNAFVTISSGSSGTLNSIWIYNSTGSSSIIRVRVDGVDISVQALIGTGAEQDSLVDSPTNYGTDSGVGGDVRGNYATWNPLDKSGNTSLANGNLEATGGSSPLYGSVRGSVGVQSGKFYFEVTASTASGACIGIADANSAFNGLNFIDDVNAAYIFSHSSGNGIYINSSTIAYTTNYSNNDVVGVAFDQTNKKVWFAVNNVWQGSGTQDPATNAGGYTYTGMTSAAPYFADGVGASVPVAIANFGQRPFAYTAPSGFKALCTTNLAEPTIADGSTAMDVALYTGNGSTQTISGLNFSPDWVWLKARSNAGSYHKLYDTVRGATKLLNGTNDTLAESTETQGLTTFNSDGFSLGTEANHNGSGITFVAWTWDAGSSTVTNTEGSITSQVRANASAGFSICTFSIASASATISTFGHGLGVAPSFVIFKVRNVADEWTVYHGSISSPTSNWVTLNTTNAAGGGTSTFSTSSTTFGVRETRLVAGGTSGDILAYCFAPVAGYSSFGSYVGNGSSDGPFCFTNFRPRWIVLKNASAAAGWYIFDASRNPYNLTTQIITANTNSAEYTDSDVQIDILSNGFKLRSGGGQCNGSSNVIVYAAFAEHPFATSRAR